VRRLPDTVEDRLKVLPDGLIEHIECVRRIARELASLHSIDVEHVDLAAAAHDLARVLDDDTLLESAREHGVEPSPVHCGKPLLLHGPVAAEWLEREAGIKNAQVLEAVRCHTTGRAGMGPVARVVFLADKLDPSKASRYPFQDDIASLAREDLDRALLQFLDMELGRFVAQGYLIDPSSVELRNELVMALTSGD